MKAPHNLLNVALASPLALLFILLCLSVFQGYQLGRTNADKQQEIAESRAQGQVNLSAMLSLDTELSEMDRDFENQVQNLIFQIEEASEEPDQIETEIERAIYRFHYPDFAKIEDRLGIELGRDPFRYAEPPDEQILTELSQMLLEFEPEERTLLAEVWSRYGTLIEYAPVADSRREVLIAALVETFRMRQRALEEDELRLANETVREKYFSTLKYYGPEFMLETMASYLSPDEIKYFQVFQQMRYEATLITANRFDFGDN